MKTLSRLIPIVIITGAITLGVLYLLREDPVSEGMLIEYADTLDTIEVIAMEYGLAVDSFFIVSGKIGRNQTLSVLLRSLGVSQDTIHKIAMASEGIFDLRKIRMGKPYKAFCSKDSLHRVQYLVYEHTPLDYVRFGIRDSIHVLRQEKEVELAPRAASGLITSSLWNTMLDNGLDPMLAFELSEIYAWTIDFFGLQEGDGFKVYFDEQYVDSTYIGLGRIHGAVFQHSGESIYAIPFDQDSVETYFDQEGNSLRRAFLKAPLRYSRISSRYSHSRLHPILKIRRPHLGVDYAAPAGTPVLAIGDGRVINAAYKKGNGYWIKIRHNSVYTTAYLHLSRFGKGVKGGAYVKQGDVIGYVGSTGLSTGPHLDFRFYKNGSPVDPLKVEAPPVNPVAEANLTRYDSVMRATMHILAGIPLSDSTMMIARP